MSEFDLIDRVARDMTEADPPGDFRVRVIQRLPDARPQPWWQLALLAGTGVAAGMLIMIGMSIWSRHQTPATPAHTASSGGVRTATPINSSSAPQLPLVINRGGGINGTRDVVGATESAGQTGQAIELPFPMLSIVPIQPGELSLAPIVVGPLSTGPLTVSPLDPARGGPLDTRPGGRQK